MVSGDSGGPLVDDEGEVIGIDTAASTGTEIDGNAIPIDNALQVVTQIRSGDESKTVRIGPGAFLGVELLATSDADDLSSALAEREPGDQVKLTWTDPDGSTRSETVTLGLGPLN